MIGLFDELLKVSIVLSAGLLAMRAMAKHSAAARHWVLASAVICALAIPVLESLAPAWRLPAIAQGGPAGAAVSVSETFSIGAPGESAESSQAAKVRTPPLARSLSISTLLGLLWLSGTCASISVLVIGLARLSWLAAHARVVTSGISLGAATDLTRREALARPVTLLQSDHPSLLVTWGWVRPKIILPACAQSWSTRRAEIVLRHELAHVRRGDWGVQLLGEALRAIYWFNPLVWIVCGRLRDESEHACDDAVLSGGVDGSDYAAELLDLARTLNAPRRQWLPAPAMARPTSLEGRVKAMLHASPNRTPVARSRKLLILAAGTLLAASVAGFELSAQSFATLSGSVTDQLGGLLPHVKMALSSHQSDQKYEVHTNDVGVYRFVGLPSGEYELTTERPGFRPTTDTVVVSAPSAVHDMTLSVGSLEETISVVGGRTAGDRPVSRAPARPVRRSEPAACVSSPLGGALKPPTKIADVRPRYPENLEMAGEGGLVVLDATIGADGTVRETQPVDASVQPDLARAAMDAVRQWRYTPTLLNCVPIDVQMKVTVRFAVE
jgi:TonB family protein